MSAHVRGGIRAQMTQREGAMVLTEVVVEVALVAVVVVTVVVVWL